MCTYACLSFPNLSSLRGSIYCVNTLHGVGRACRSISEEEEERDQAIVMLQVRRGTIQTGRGGANPPPVTAGAWASSREWVQVEKNGGRGREILLVKWSILFYRGKCVRHTQKVLSFILRCAIGNVI